MGTKVIFPPYGAFVSPYANRGNNFTLCSIFSPYAPEFVCVIFFGLQWVAICQMSANKLSDSNMKAYFQKYYSNYEFNERELAFHSNCFWWLSCGPFPLLRQ
jgi:hypothetical protein